MAIAVQKKYQVFISSTYEDLKIERDAITKVVLDANCIPVGMELFPATDDEPLDYIHKAIDDCDFFILILAGKYGSIRPDTGLSYTEEEYDYAKSRNKLILRFTYGDITKLPQDKVESDPERKAKLSSFRTKVCESGLKKDWDNLGDLKYGILSALSRTDLQEKAVGWIRADAIQNVKLSPEYAALLEENKNLSMAVNNLKDQLKSKGASGQKSTLLDRVECDDLTKWEMDLIRAMVASDESTISLSELCGDSDNYTHFENAMYQLAELGVGEPIIGDYGEEKFRLFDSEFRAIRKSELFKL